MPEYLYRIYLTRAPGVCARRSEGEQECQNTGRGEEIPWERNAVGEVLEPAAHRPPGPGARYDEGYDVLRGRVKWMTFELRSRTEHYRVLLMIGTTLPSCGQRREAMKSAVRYC